MAAPGPLFQSHLRSALRELLNEAFKRGPPWDENHSLLGSEEDG